MDVFSQLVCGSRATKRASVEMSSDEGDGREDGKKRSTSSTRRQHERALSPPPEHECYLCLEVAGRPTRSGVSNLLRAGCGCRGSVGRAHLHCLVRAAEHKPQSWTECPTCRQAFTGVARFELAQVRWERARSTLPDETNEWQAAIRNFAFALTTAGRFEEALPLSEEGLAASERALGPEHPNTLCHIDNMGTLLHDKGDLAAAEPLWQRALETRERTLGPEHSNSLIAVNNLACLLLHKGDLAAAKPLVRRALEVVSGGTLGPEHRDALDRARAIAGCYGRLVVGRKVRVFFNVVWEAARGE